MSHFKNSLCVFLALVLTASAGSMRAAGKFREHGRFSNPKNMFIYLSFDSGYSTGGEIRQFTHNEIRFTTATSFPTYGKVGMPYHEELIGDSPSTCGQAYLGGQRPEGMWRSDEDGISTGSAYDIWPKGGAQGHITCGMWVDINNQANGSWSRIWTMSLRKGYAYRAMIHYGSTENFVWYLRDYQNDAIYGYFGTVVGEESHLAYAWNGTSESVLAWKNTVEVADVTHPNFDGFAADNSYNSCNIISHYSGDGWISDGYCDEWFICEDVWTAKQVALWALRGKH